jgi:uncharacterized phage-associated protein
MSTRKLQNVADYIIFLSRQDKKTVCNLKLQKLLFYAQGWFLAEKNRPLFEDEFQAWVYGPAIPSLYGELKQYGSYAISKIIDQNAIELLPEEIQHLDDIYASYGDFTSTELVSLTHNEKSWQDARAGILPYNASSNVISKDDIKKDFEEKLQKLLNDKTK